MLSGPSATLGVWVSSHVAVPATSLARNSGNETVVWVHQAAEHFVARRVRAVALDATRALVVDGLAGGERIVARGAQALSQIR